MSHSKGVSLRELNRTKGRRYWRDEAGADGGKPVLRRILRRAGNRTWRREWADSLSRRGAST